MQAYRDYWRDVRAERGMVRALDLILFALFHVMAICVLAMIALLLNLHSLPYAAYVVHFGLEVVGQGVLWLAYTHVCSKQWHRVAIWFLGTLLTTIVTVHLIG